MHAEAGVAVGSRRRAGGYMRGLGWLVWMAVVAAGLALAPAARAALTDGFETGDLSALPWLTYGNVPWTVQNSVASEGSWAAASVGQPQAKGSTLELNVYTLSESATITFKFRACLNTSSILDYLIISVNGVTAASYHQSTEGFADGSFVVGPGSHQIRFTYITGNGGGAGYGVWIDQVFLPDYVLPLPRAAFAISPSRGPAPLTVAFTDQSSFTFSYPYWFWDFGDGGTSTEQNPTHVYAAVGTYDVTLTVAHAGGSDQLTKVDAVTVVEAVVADFTGTPLNGAAPLTVAFADASTGGVTGWSWAFGDGGTSTEQNPSHEYLEGGTYTVALTVTGPGGEVTETKTDYVAVDVTDATPAPGTMAFAVYPVASSATAVAMAAEEADSYQGVEYYFEETSGSDGGSDSGWQASRFYTDEGLTPGTTYLYRVKARARVSTASETGYSGIAAATTLPRESFETGDLSSVAWTTSTTAPWVVQGDTVFSDNWAAASAEGLADGGVSTLSLTREVLSGTVRFRVALSSEAGADVLRFLVDGEEQASWSGNVPWTSYAVAVGAGEHTFSWEYVEGVPGASGTDRAYLDDVEFPAQVVAVAPIVIGGGGGGGCVVGGEASGAGTLLAVLLPLGLLGRAKRRR